MTIEINNTTRQRVNEKLLKKAIDVFGREFKLKNKFVSVAIVGDTVIRKLNKQYRHKDKITDVLSFVDGGKDGNLGEIVICYQQIKRQAKKLNSSIAKEFVFIFIHGLLHLVGYNDKTEKGWQEMEKIGLQLCKSVIDNRS